MGHLLCHHEDLVLTGARYEGVGFLGQFIAAKGPDQCVVVVLSHLVHFDILLDIELRVEDNDPLFCELVGLDIPEDFESVVSVDLFPVVGGGGLFVFGIAHYC